jgi:KaiC/GvpD/RAD55 family RecA-like ATPase
MAVHEGPKDPMAKEGTAGTIPTGIEGLDQKIEGLTRGGSILLIGDEGSGKTAFALQFAKSACSLGLRTVFISIDRGGRQLRQQAKSSGWDIAPLEDKKLLSIVDHSQIEACRIELAGLKCVAPHKGNFTELMRYLTPGTEVMVIDRLDEYASGLSLAEFHDGLEFFVRRLHDRGITALILMDGTAPAGWKKLAMESMGGVIQFFRWDNPTTGRMERALDIVKLTGAPAPMGAMAYELVSAGIAVRLEWEKPHDLPPLRVG